MTTLEEKEKIRLTIQKLRENDKEWLVQQDIRVGHKANYWVLNYGISTKNEYNRLFRGMVVAKPQDCFNGDNLELIVTFPFIRFFNTVEGNVAPIDYENAEMLEKLDGTMVCVSFPDKKCETPLYSTRKMVSAEPKDINFKVTSFIGKKFPFMPLIGSYVKKLDFCEAELNHTYIFEFIHEASYVVTKYRPEQYGLYLIGARNVITHKELSELELDSMARNVGAFRPRRWNATQAEAQRIIAEASIETPDFEGFIFRDKVTGNRAKLKNLDYLRKHRALTDVRSFRTLAPLVLQGEADEIVGYFPHAKQNVDEILRVYENYVDEVTAKVLSWKLKGLEKKQLALELHGQHVLPKWQRRLNAMHGESIVLQKGENDPFARSMILECHSLKVEDVRNKVDASLKAIALGSGTNAGNAAAFMETIGLHEKEVVADVGEI